MSEHAGQTGSVELSATGLGRRDAILGELHAAMGRQVRRRRALQAGGAVAVLAVVAGAAALTLRSGGPSGAGPRGSGELASGGDAPDQIPAIAMQNASFRIIETGSAARLDMISVIDDDRLLKELRAIGYPTGLIRAGGAVLVTGPLEAKLAEPEAGRG